jgi:hypothetical protein
MGQQKHGPKWNHPRGPKNDHQSEIDRRARSRTAAAPPASDGKVRRRPPWPEFVVVATSCTDGLLQSRVVA